MTAKGPYIKVYQSIVDDPMFERVYDNDKALATWVRMLLIADAMHPTSAPMPPRNPSVRLLIASGLVVERSGNRYSMRGLEADRERRSAQGRNAAAMRWQSPSNAEVMPSKAEQSRTEQSKGNGDAPASATSFIRYKPKPSLHDGSHPNCLVCAPLQAAPSSEKGTS